MARDQDRKSGRAMLLGDMIEAEAAPDSARLAIFDQAYARLLRTGD